MKEQTASKVPQIRFKGIEGDWEGKKLGEVGGFNPKEALPEVFEYVDLESVVGTEMVSHRTETRKTAPSRAQRLARQGDLFFQTVRPYQKNNHLFTLPFANYVFSTGYAQIRPFNDGSFLLGLMQRDQFVKVVLDHCTGTSYPAINANVLAGILATIPRPEEQQKIGTYFRTLDDLIGMHQRKHDKLVTLKKAMLQKLFPQDGATTPEIRFKGFSGEWVEKKLEDVFSYERPDQYIVESSEYSNENRIPVLTANKAFILGYTNETRTFNKPCIIFDDFTLEAKFVDFPFMVKSSAIKLLTIQDNKVDDLYFAFLTLRNAQIEIMGHARHYIGVVQPTLVRKPKIAEQQKIGSYFLTLDKLISKHAIQLQKLKQIKSACLEKMFV